MNSMTSPLIAQYKLTSQLFDSVLEGIDDHTAGIRLNDKTNHILFIAGHIVSSRYGSANLLGLGAASPFNGICNRGATLQEPSKYPPLPEMLQEWHSISDRLFELLEITDDNKLLEPLPVGFPTVDTTIRGGLHFLAGHEMFHIGQLIFLRKSFGLPSPIDR